MNNEQLVEFVENIIDEHELDYYIVGLQRELDLGNLENLTDTELVAKIGHINKAVNEVEKFYSQSVELLNNYIIIANARKLLTIIGNKDS